MGSLTPVKEETSPTVVHSVQKMSLLNISGEHYEEEEERPQAPIVASYNDRIRPLLDTVDSLRHLKIMQEGIQLPTIVVVGDQSSGKSSVLESLAGISLPRGQVVPTDEEHIADAINLATEEIAGKGKGISNSPLTLVVKKMAVPDLTMVDLPGITRVPVHGQPEDIYEQISNIIMEFITPEESIILNVLSASVDFSTCESIRMSQRVDKTGQRTLAVVTKADRSPEGLLEKVTADDVNIGLGYVCVRNRIGDETYEEAREEEAKLFETNPQLSKINKSMVGIPVLAEKLVKIQATIIVKCLPEIVRKINDKLSANIEDLNKLPKHLNSVAEAMTTFMHILGSAKESLRKIILQGEFDEYPDSAEMHCTARLAEMLNQYSTDLQSKKYVDNDPKKNFLLDEMKVLEESKSIGLPRFLPRAAFLTLLQQKVTDVSMIPFEFVDKIWSYLGDVVVSVLLRHCDNYPQLLSCTRRAAKNLIDKKHQQSIEWVKDMVEMEKLTDYTCNPEYMASCNKLMSHQDEFIKIVNGLGTSWNIQIDGFGLINVGHLHGKGSVVDAFDVKMRMTAYWDIVLRRMVDNMALHLTFSIQNLVKKEMQTEIIDELIGPQGNSLERSWRSLLPLLKSGRSWRKASSCSRSPRTLLPTSWTGLSTISIETEDVGVRLICLSCEP
ncbi:UNVERIFIED_CONTAM: Dynamin-related protein 4C [Sesamum calycinum]|uniref:Dynamin-related protein 4C n=1 Tax=Sesamum calycinum TaxID=2727403 RepID=A0AAW2M1J5_9LAMI